VWHMTCRWWVLPKHLPPHGFSSVLIQCSQRASYLFPCFTGTKSTHSTKCSLRQKNLRHLPSLPTSESAFQKAPNFSPGEVNDQ
jgi:hypothetical protein